MDPTALELEGIMRKHLKLAEKDENNFTIRSQLDILSSFGAASKTLTTLLASIAAVSLLVGGIGIMNIMLVSVTERTREIGIRMAIGARKRDIRYQFLIEAVTIAMIGGIIGILLGVGGAFALANFAGWNTAVAPKAIVMSFVFSALVGIVFGLFPAMKASNLNPIESLRYE
jgi:putative ABC transport system permease protein